MAPTGSKEMNDERDDENETDLRDRARRNDV
jgi:hypothetical protein